MTFEKFREMVEKNSYVHKKGDVTYRLCKFIEEFTEMLSDKEGTLSFREERQDCFYTLALLANALDNIINMGEICGSKSWVNQNIVLNRIITIHTKPTAKAESAVNDAYRWLISGWANVDGELDEAYKRLVDNDYEIE